jgi:hypothetical protein
MRQIWISGSDGMTTSPMIDLFQEQWERTTVIFLSGRSILGVESCEGLAKTRWENQDIMQSAWNSKGKKLHTRNIKVSTYAYDGRRIMVEGILKDDRFQEAHFMTGEIAPSGVIHHMAIRLLVDCSNLLIEDVEVDMISVPREICRETIDSLSSIKGLTITKGFTLKVKKLAGGNKGCTHLMELIQAMAPAVFQGFASHQSQKPSAFDPDRARKVLQLLTDTCHAWRDGGPYVEMLKKKIKGE